MSPVRGLPDDDFSNMPGLGAIYGRVARYIFGDATKYREVMALAPHGKPNRLTPLVELREDQLAVPDWGAEFDKPWFPGNSLPWELSPFMQHWKDIAGQLQTDTERVLLQRARWLRETTGARNLVVAGSVTLNEVASRRLIRESGFDNIWFEPIGGDSGVALGCAFYGVLNILDQPRSEAMRQTRSNFGRTYEDEEITKAVNQPRVRVLANNRRSEDICGDIARCLAESMIAGWVQGGSEFGACPLGNRSLLAAPCSAVARDKLLNVKSIPTFLPCSLIVPLERVDEIFIDLEASPFLRLVKEVRPEWRDRLLGCLDGSRMARVQTVSAETSLKLHELLQRFAGITGVPLLINVALSRADEPIVESPDDAVECFLGSEIDCLAIHDFLLTKTTMHRLISPLLRHSGRKSSALRAGPVS